MKILKKAYIFDDFSIQLEDWRDDFAGYNLDPAIIAAYPKGKWRCRFRGECTSRSLEEAERIFENLRDGKATVFDFDFTVMVPGGKRVPMADMLKKNE